MKDFRWFKFRSHVRTLSATSQHRMPLAFWAFRSWATALLRKRGSWATTLSCAHTVTPKPVYINMSSILISAHYVAGQVSWERDCGRWQAAHQHKTTATNRKTCHFLSECTNGLKWTLPVLRKWIYIERLNGFNSIMFHNIAIFFWLLVTCTSSYHILSSQFSWESLQDLGGPTCLTKPSAAQLVK